MLTTKALLQQPFAFILPTARTPAALLIHRALPRLVGVHRRQVSTVTSKNANDMGGPGGQEHLPESNALRRKYRMNTMFGVAAACSFMLAVKLARMNRDANAEYVLVHDASKGELDDVKYIKASELPKKT